jgi:hypothetical protein
MLTDRDETLQQRSFGLEQFVLDANGQMLHHKHVDDFFVKVSFFCERFKQHQRAHFGVV